MNLPQLGMGTWGMGGTFAEDPSNFDESVEALRFGLAFGLRLIDVAELHGNGLTEKIVGEAIKGYPRKKIFIISKVSREHLDYDKTLRAAEGSLKRLGTDYIDLYLVHKLPPENPAPQEETFRALGSLLKEGLARHVGVSNFTAAQIETASRYLAPAKIEANEIEYNLIFQEAEQKTIPYCRSKDIRVIAHRPFGKGLLFKQPIPFLYALAEKYGKTVAQIAINWIMSQGMTAIPKASDKKHIQENLGALGWKLHDEDITLLRTLGGSVPYERIK